MSTEVLDWDSFLDSLDDVEEHSPPDEPVVPLEAAPPRTAAPTHPTRVPRTPSPPGTRAAAPTAMPTQTIPPAVSGVLSRVPRTPSPPGTRAANVPPLSTYIVARRLEALHALVLNVRGNVQELADHVVRLQSQVASIIVSKIMDMVYMVLNNICGISCRRLLTRRVASTAVNCFSPLLLGVLGAMASRKQALQYQALACYRGGKIVCIILRKAISGRSAELHVRISAFVSAAEYLRQAISGWSTCAHASMSIRHIRPCARPSLKQEIT